MHVKAAMVNIAGKWVTVRIVLGNVPDRGSYLFWHRPRSNAAFMCTRLFLLPLSCRPVVVYMYPSCDRFRFCCIFCGILQRVFRFFYGFVGGLYGLIRRRQSKIVNTVIAHDRSGQSHASTVRLCLYSAVMPIQCGCASTVRLRGYF